MRALRPILFLVLVGAVGCSGGENKPAGTPGFLTLTLSTPNSNDGGILFKITGGKVDSVAASSMVQDGSYVINPSFTRAVVAGNIVDGVIVRIHVPDVAAVANYQVTVEQASNRYSFTQQNIAGYSIAVTQ